MSCAADTLLVVPLTRVCRLSEVATSLTIDDRLLKEAHRLGGQQTKKATVTEALQEYIQHRKQPKILKLFGSVELDPKYHYKRQRRRP